MHSYKSKLLLAVGAALALSLAFPLVTGELAFADKTTRKIEKKNREAMENFDLLEYEEAKKLLNQAIVMAKKAGKSKSSAVAKVHLNLGIVYFSGFQDVESAKLEFINAVEIDAKVELDPAYKTAEMEKILVEAKKEFGGSSDDGDDDDDEIDCASLMGIQHTLVDTADGGASKDVSAHVADALKAAKITLHYRPEGVADFIEGKMKKAGGCTYSATIPAESVNGEFLHYYVAAYNKSGKVIASKGSAGSPNIIEITGGSSGSNNDDNENPLGDGGGGGGGRVGDDDSGGSITKIGPRKPKQSKLFISIGAGTGAGYVNGATEQRGNEIGCCLAPALLHLFPELGYYLSRTDSLSFAFRMGFPIGANLPGHATAAPAGFLRYRHALDASGDGLQVSASIGGGIIRHTVKLSDATAEEDTDTAATGPLFIGGGAGYTHAMGGPIKFVAELNAIAGIPVVEEMGTCPGSGCVKPNFALHFDVNLALLFAF
jgi:hypothetical protein